MQPEEVERLLEKLEPASVPARAERKILSQAELRQASTPERPGEARRVPSFRLRGLATVAASFLVLGIILWRVVVPPSSVDGAATPCRRDLEFETSAPGGAGGDLPAAPGEFFVDLLEPLLRRADPVKPVPQELAWQKIPWVTDLVEAQRLARDERRPLFLWVSNDDPLDRCCGCAAWLRVGPLSDEGVIHAVIANFVPAAVDMRKLQQSRDPGRELLRSVQRQKPQYHGLWIATPEGKVLAGHEDRKSKDLQGWTREVLETIDAALKAFGPVEPRRPGPVRHLPHRGVGVATDGSVGLALYSRFVRNGSRDGPVVLDSVTLEAHEWATIVPPRAEPGTAWALPESLARKLVRALSPVSDHSSMPRPENAKAAGLRAEIMTSEGSRAAVRLTGTWETEHLSEKRTIRASASTEGLAVYDLSEKRMVSLLLVFTGTYRDRNPGDVPRPFGAVLEWNLTAR